MPINGDNQLHRRRSRRVRNINRPATPIGPEARHAVARGVSPWNIKRELQSPGGTTIRGDIHGAHGDGRMVDALVFHAQDDLYEQVALDCFPQQPGKFGLIERVAMRGRIEPHASHSLLLRPRRIDTANGREHPIGARAVFVRKAAIDLVELLSNTASKAPAQALVMRCLRSLATSDSVRGYFNLRKGQSDRWMLVSMISGTEGAGWPPSLDEPSAPLPAA